jgi:1,4-dihydroxy-2-naphthoyl-CoA hydrolase
MSLSTDTPWPDMKDVGQFIKAAGFVVEELTGTRVSGYVEVGPQHHTPWGVAHGGLYTTIAETAASIGASVAVRELEQFAVGVNNNTDFLKSIREGRVDIVAEPLAQGRVQQLWQVVIRRHEDGRLIARGTVRLQNVPINK